MTNTLEQKDVMISELGFLIRDAIRELEKRDDLLTRNAIQFDMMNELNKELSEQLRKEKMRKKANKWFYFGAGLVVGVVGVKQLNK